MIALLLFILGLWLWDHHFGKANRYAPETETGALMKIDRDLRLADAMAADPPWLRWLAAASTQENARSNAEKSLQILRADNALGPAGMEALVVISANAQRVSGQTMAMAHDDFAEATRDLSNHRGTWWQARLVESMESSRQPLDFWKTSFGRDNTNLRTRAILVRSSVWMLGLTGLMFLPATVRTIRKSFNSRPAGYPSRWTIPLGLIVFLASTLAWIGFVAVVEIGISSVPPFHPALGILIDSAVRLLPACIALAFLFRKPRHVFRSLGLNTLPRIRPVLGILPVLMVLDLGLHSLLGSGAEDPAGGLNAADAGLWGLVFSVVSACIVAPVSEEIIHRGIVFPAFRNSLGLGGAVLVSTVIFTLLHFYDGYGLASVAVFGASCALLFAATRSLTTAILLHMLYNALIKIPEWIVYHAPLG